MSRDAHLTSLHLHSPHHADLFEEFCRPPAVGNAASSQQLQPPSLANQHPQHSNTTTTQPTTDAASGMVALPGHFLPFEEIALPPELMPLNPEDEDGVVPDMHAAFGILRALGPPGHAANGTGAVGYGQQAGGEESRAGAQRGEETWRDLGMEGVLASGGGDAAGRGARSGIGNASAMGARHREGRRMGLLLMR
ncbi:uncharacterized protein HMPREF1541_09686 [Cyphellophora europaea CBS 101466]|uniref:Uncharacterized protein n=1 Tax=Cyphellophora europaea (strain CBS 101466) TaxID=1220924 RepID=W2S7Y2_CYPE1|nr:uncharacterized protein HMPREF1541_09686 [Cyphellophora europaea CBS 101466]ETN44811.1 hypothetical protein HMPREF1541_09686 [Cyphellophora europaea CBS 101466]